MNVKPISVAATLFLLLALTACGEPTLSASSHDEIHMSILEMAKTGVATERELKSAVDTITRDVSDRIRLPGNRKIALQRRLDGLTAEDLMAEAHRLDAERDAHLRAAVFEL